MVFFFSAFIVIFNYTAAVDRNSHQCNGRAKFSFFSVFLSHLLLYEA